MSTQRKSKSARCQGAGTKRQRRKAEPFDAAAYIDELLLTSVPVVGSSQTGRMTSVEVIVLQLMKNEKDGNAQASKILRRYKKLISPKTDPRPRLVFAENDHSRSSGSQSARTNG